MFPDSGNNRPTDLPRERAFTPILKMAFFKNENDKPMDDPKRRQAADSLWLKCNNCGEIIYRKEIERNLMVCPKCDYHFRLSSEEWIALLCDEGSFREIDREMSPVDVLGFRDRLKYKDRIVDAEAATGLREAYIFGEAKIDSVALIVGFFDFRYMGGSMGIVVGEKITRSFEEAIKQNKAVVIFSSSGGARMQEGIYSLMQMVKTSMAVEELGRRRLPFISVLTDPTTGGVAASFSMLGDVIIAEPKALIGFAGPRVVEETIRQKLPPGFQRSEFLLEHGFVDMIVVRSEIKKVIAKLIRMLLPSGT